jgi:glutamine synthetase
MERAMAELGGPPDLVARLEAMGARHLWVVYHNYSALAQAKVVGPLRYAEVAATGVSFAKANWDFAITDHQHPHAVLAAHTGDFRVVPDPASLVRLAYRDGVAQAYGWLVDDHGPWAGDPRARLADQVVRLAELGQVAAVAFESEFVLLRHEGAGWAPDDRGRMFTVDEIEARWRWCADVLAVLDEAGVAVHQLAREYGRAQYELSLLPADPVTAVDRFLLARQVVRAMARDAGLVASFMPKPWTDAAGNGLHVHVSLQDADGRPLFEDPADPAVLSMLGRQAVAGLLAHAGGQVALSAPTPNSFKRLQPGSWAPAHRCWAFGNRAALVRIPGTGANRHIEYRLADASANPYILVTGLLASILDGQARDLSLTPPADVDVGHWSDEEAAAAGWDRLPDRPSAALDALEADDMLLDALGPVIAERYPSVKRFEDEAYLEETGATPGDAAVTDWERRAYLEHV